MMSFEVKVVWIFSWAVLSFLVYAFSKVFVLMVDVTFAIFSVPPR